MANKLPDPGTLRVHIPKRHADIIQRRSPRDQVEALKNKAYLPVTDLSKLVAREFRDILLPQDVVAGRRCVQAADNVHQS